MVRLANFLLNVVFKLLNVNRNRWNWNFIFNSFTKSFHGFYLRLQERCNVAVRSHCGVLEYLLSYLKKYLCCTSKWLRFYWYTIKSLRFIEGINIWVSLVTFIPKFTSPQNYNKDNMSYGATVGASAANSNLIEFKK